MSQDAASGVMHWCRCWVLRRGDGKVLGFTDHDTEITFDGVVFRAASGLTAHALQQTTGLAVDNAEVVGAVTSSAVSEQDLRAGRFDGAEVELWLVDWRQPDNRVLRFQGSLGDIEYGGGQFRAELRGLSERLNTTVGRVYRCHCSAALGDGQCRLVLDDPRFRAETEIVAIANPEQFITVDVGLDTTWLSGGVVEVLTGAAEGLHAHIQSAEDTSEGLKLTLWDSFRVPLAEHDRVKLTVGCDKRATSCRERFANFLNFRGFPHIPGEDWLAAVPNRGGLNDGGRRDG
ncbi:DUF2163 domain-containing protein [Qingshengfaniella alkalisoli]|nr:DUF2163 domain-containing protein [Qingshengfaniella alkalisoli]